MRKPRIAVIELLVVLFFGYLFLNAAYAVWAVFNTDVVEFLASVRGVVDREPYPSPNRWWGLLALAALFVCLIMPFRLLLHYLERTGRRDK